VTASDAADTFGAIPAAAVIAACLQAQAAVPARSGFAKAFGRSPLSVDSRPWYLGALGELRVAAQLAKLGPDWAVLHSVPVGDRGSDVDHVLLGPAGVFTINTKFHEDARIWLASKRLLVNGQKTDYLRNSRYEAQRISRRVTAATGVPIDAHPAIILVRPRSITIRERPTDVAVLRDTELVRWLNRLPTTLDNEARGRITAAVTRRESWDGGHGPAPEVDEAAFADLRREVTVARRVRVAWATATLLGILTIAGTFAINAYSTLLT
jgi:hypothetical protein